MSHGERNEDWTRLDALLGAALDLPPGERSAFLDGACAGDLRLRARVDALLAAERKAESFFEEPWSALGPDPELPAAPGDRWGPYRLERRIGSGGMATVFLARRDDASYDRRVAIKIFHRGADPPEMELRFRRERQTLARLEHPNIARLYEAGTSEEGRPYLVMEYVEGEPLDVYCDRRCFGIEQRLALFDPICSAVHHAHQNLLVHRDLKPSNLLVTEAGEPKLLDFGIAKPLAPGRIGERLELTRTGLQPMTPGYASPEQIRGEPIATASDVYGVGLLLYELLSGRRPYRVTGVLPHELERAILEDEPEPPSRAVERIEVGDSAVATETLARARGSSPRELGRRLRGDLDSIVLKAMRKDPRQRYASAERLAEDLRRYREKRPVRARKGSLRYRAAKLVRRHWLPVSALLVILIFLAGFLVTSVVQARRLAREQKVAETRRLEAENEREKAQHALDFLVDVFRVAEPGEGGTVTAREILEAGAEKISQELQGQPDAQATLMDAIGRAYLSLGLDRPAAPLLERALTLRRQSDGGEPLEVASSLRSLAQLDGSRGRYRDAETLLREALAIERKGLGPGDPGTVATLQALSDTLTRLGELDAAEPLAREALAIRQGANPQDPLAIAESQQVLARVLLRRGDYGEVERLRREELATRRRLLSPSHSQVAESLANLALTLNIRGKHEEAARLTREALEIFRKILPPDHPAIATTLQNLAQILHSQGDLTAAQASYREALALRRAKYGDRNPLVAVTMNNLGAVLQDESRQGSSEKHQAKLDEALALHRQALDIRRAVFGDQHPAVANSLCNLGEARRFGGDLPAAESHYRQCLALLRELVGDDHPTVSHALAGLGRVLLDRGEPKAAVDLLRHALAIRRRSFPPGHRRIAESEGALGACFTALGRYREAEPLLLDSQANLARQLRPEDRRLRLAASRLEELYRAWGKPGGGGGTRSQTERDR